MEGAMGRAIATTTAMSGVAKPSSGGTTRPLNISSSLENSIHKLKQKLFMSSLAVIHLRRTHHTAFHIFLFTQLYARVAKQLLHNKNKATNKLNSTKETPATTLACPQTS